MTFTEFMDNILTESNLGIEFAAYRYINPPSTYMTYRKYENTPTDSADDKVTARKYYVQIDIFSTEPCEYLADKLIDFLETKDFISRSSFSDFEEDTGLFREGMRFEYTQPK